MPPLFASLKHFRVRNLLSAAVLAALFAAPLPASATLISTDLNSSGDGLVTFDDQTGFEWLDLPLTQGMSVNTALTAYDSFRIATYSEVFALLTNAGIAGINSGSTVPGDLAGGTAIRDLMGATTSYFSGAIVQIQAQYYSDDLTQLPRLFMEVRNSPASPTGTYTSLPANSLPACLACSSTDFANFLVREATVLDAPGSAMLLAAGFGLVTLRKRRQDRQGR